MSFYYGYLDLIVGMRLPKYNYVITHGISSNHWLKTPMTEKFNDSLRADSTVSAEERKGEEAIE